MVTLNNVYEEGVKTALEKYALGAFAKPMARGVVRPMMRPGPSVGAPAASFGSMQQPLATQIAPPVAPPVAPPAVTPVAKPAYDPSKDPYLTNNGYKAPAPGMAAPASTPSAPTAPPTAQPGFLQRAWSDVKEHPIVYGAQAAMIGLPLAGMLANSGGPQPAPQQPDPRYGY